MMKLTSVSILARRPELAALISVKFSCRVAHISSSVIFHCWTEQQTHSITHSDNQSHLRCLLVFQQLQLICVCLMPV